MNQQQEDDNLNSQGISARKKARSSLRIKYEAETELIKKQLGDLEEIRDRLGLSQRKMCQLLLVDPSSWTRWIRQNAEPPPHIYRMLEWYLALSEKLPSLTTHYYATPGIFKGFHKKISETETAMRDTLNSILEQRKLLEYHASHLRRNRAVLIFLFSLAFAMLMALILKHVLLSNSYLL